jgi:hypothetical protein
MIYDRMSYKQQNAIIKINENRMQIFHKKYWRILRNKSKYKNHILGNEFMLEDSPQQALHVYYAS